MAEGQDNSNEQSEKFLLAAENGELDVLKKMLKEVPSSLVNCTDEDLYTPLHRAAYNDHGSVIKFLVENGGDIEAETIDGWHPLHSASHWNCSHSANALLQLGADINAKSKGGNTPLHIAALKSRGGPEVMKILLSDSNIDITLTNNESETARVVAARNGPYESLFKIANPNLNLKEDELCKFTVLSEKCIEKEDSV